MHGGHLAAAVRSAMALRGPGCPRCLPGRQLVGYGAAPRLSSALGLRGADGAVTERGRSWSAAGAGHTRPVPTASCAYKYRSSRVPPLCAELTAFLWSNTQLRRLFYSVHLGQLPVNCDVDNSAGFGRMTQRVPPLA